MAKMLDFHRPHQHNNYNIFMLQLQTVIVIFYITNVSRVSLFVLDAYDGSQNICMFTPVQYERNYICRNMFVIEMVYSIHGTYKVTFHPDGPKVVDAEKRLFEIDFTPPFKRSFLLL